MREYFFELVQVQTFSGLRDAGVNLCNFRFGEQKSEILAKNVKFS
jgi:hypothetical protein